MTTFTLNALGGSDTVDIAATGTGVAYDVNVGSGNDLVTMVASAVVTGSTYDLDGGTGIDTLIVDAQGAAVTVSRGRDPDRGPARRSTSRTSRASRSTMRSRHRRCRASP